MQRTIRTVVKTKVDQFTYGTMYPTGTMCGKLYGTAKIHKEGVPVRPIVSMVNTPNYELAKYVDQLIRPFCPKKYTVESSFDFISKLRHFVSLNSNNNALHVVSYDVTSLFTNIPLNDVIDYVIHYIFGQSSTVVGFPYDKNTFKKLLHVATEGMFSFDNKIYKQIDGIAMGNPLAPTLADFFMGHIENTIFSNPSEYFPSFYCRYVDDTFCVFSHSSHSQQFLNSINSVHNNIKFTVENSQNGTLPYLDVKVFAANDDIGFTVFRKPTFTGRLLNFKSLVPKIWKRNTVHAMIFRAYHLTSSWKFFHEEVQKIKDILCFNNYPKWWLEKSLRGFLDKIYAPEETLQEGKVTNFHHIKIPFYGKPSVKLKKDIMALLKCIGNKKAKVCFTMTRLSSYFTNKDRTSCMLLSNIVYKYTCSVDQSIFYVGETKRQLVRRANSHWHDPNSAINKHLAACETCKKSFFSNFKVLAKGGSSYDTEVKEALMIKKLNPPLNIQQVTGKRAAVLHLF